MKIVEVHWDDAWVSTNSLTVKQALKKQAIKTITVGQLIAENDAGVVMVLDSYPKTPKEGRVVNFVPWEMITDYYSYEDV